MRRNPQALRRIPLKRIRPRLDGVGTQQTRSRLVDYHTALDQHPTCASRTTARRQGGTSGWAAAASRFAMSVCASAEVRTNRARPQTHAPEAWASRVQPGMAAQRSLTATNVALMRWRGTVAGSSTVVRWTPTTPHCQLAITLPVAQRAPVSVICALRLRHRPPPLSPSHLCTHVHTRPLCSFICLLWPPG
jgi:hypothetical protein